MSVVVKIQRSLNDPSAPILVYPRSRAWQALLDHEDVPEAVQSALNHALKVYWRAELDGGEVSFEQQVADEAW